MIQSRASFLAIGFFVLLLIILNSLLYFNYNRKLKQFLKLGFILIPILITVLINQTIISEKGADMITRASTISLALMMAQ